MIKCLFSGLEDGGTYQLRTTPFDCIEGFEKILSDFDKMYESYQNAQSLFSFFGNGKIVLTADTYTLGADIEWGEGVDINPRKKSLTADEQNVLVKNLLLSKDLYTNNFG